MSMMTFLKRLSPRFGAPMARERIPVISYGREAGVVVSHETAMTIAAYYRCVRVIADSLAYIDWRVKRARSDGGADIQATHPVDYLIYKKANASMTAFQLKELLVAWALTWGNGYAYIERNKRNEVEALWPVAPWYVEVKIGEDWGIAYQVTMPRKDPIMIDGRDMLHLKNLGDNGYEGYSVVTLARRSLGLAIATEDHGNALFGNAARPAGVLEHPGKLSPEAKDAIRDDWNRRFQGPGKAWGTAVLQEGMKFNSLSLPSEDAQFLETRKFSVIDICRWVGVHPYKAYDLEGMKYSNTEHVNRDFHSDTLAPWAKRMEQEADDKLLGQDVLFTDFDFRQLLRGDVAARTAMYTSLFDRGAYSPNDIRIREGDNPIPNGDERFVPMNIQTLERATKEPEPVPPALAPPTDQPDEDAEDDAEETPTADQEELSVLRGLLADGLVRILRRTRRVAEKAKNKHAEAGEFKTAMFEHIASSRGQAAEDLKQAINAVGKFACNREWGWWADFTLSAFLNQRCGKELKFYVETFERDDFASYLEMTEAGRANDQAGALLNSCMIAAYAASELEANDEQRKETRIRARAGQSNRRGHGREDHSRNGAGGSRGVQDSVSR